MTASTLKQLKHTCVCLSSARTFESSPLNFDLAYVLHNGGRLETFDCRMKLGPKMYQKRERPMNICLDMCMVNSFSPGAEG